MTLNSMAGSIILRTGYGIQVQRHNDSYIELAETAMHAMGTVLSAGSYLVDMFPIRAFHDCVTTRIRELKDYTAVKHVPDWLPGAEFKRQANAWRPYAIDLAAVPFKEGKKRVVSTIFRSLLVKAVHICIVFIGRRNCSAQLRNRSSSGPTSRCFR